MEKLSVFARTVARAIDRGEYSDAIGTKLVNVTGHIYGYNLTGEQNSEGLTDEGTLFVTFNDGYNTQRTMGTNLPNIDITDFYKKMNCFNFIVNPDLQSNPSLVNCSSEALKGESAYAVTRGFGYVNSNPSLFREGKLLDYVAGISSEMGIDSAQAKKFEANYTDVLTGIDNQRIAVSGVDVNEEMVMMLKHQQLYQASAKLVNVVNGIYGTLINNLGA
jgi:flagellar hook-associated protein 1 FlgK